MTKIAVLGAGSWGTALAMVLSENGHHVNIWGNMPERIEEINQKHTNEHYLPGVKLAESIIGYTDLEEALKDVSFILLVVPTSAIRSVTKQINALLDDKQKNRLLSMRVKVWSKFRISVSQLLLTKRWLLKNTVGLWFYPVRVTLKK